MVQPALFNSLFVYSVETIACRANSSSTSLSLSSSVARAPGGSKYTSKVLSVLKEVGGGGVGTDHRGRGGVGSVGWSPGPHAELPPIFASFHQVHFR